MGYTPWRLQSQIRLSMKWVLRDGRGETLHIFSVLKLKDNLSNFQTNPFTLQIEFVTNVVKRRVKESVETSQSLKFVTVESHNHPGAGRADTEIFYRHFGELKN